VSTFTVEELTKAATNSFPLIIRLECITGRSRHTLNQRCSATFLPTTWRTISAAKPPSLADISRLTTYPRIRARQSYFDAASTVSPALLTGTPKEGDPAYVLPEPAGRGLHPLTFQLNSSRF